MKAFLEDLEALLVKHPDIVIASSYSNGKVVFINRTTNHQAITSKGRTVCSHSVYRLKRELESNDD